jgi:hypothetical protein
VRCCRSAPPVPDLAPCNHESAARGRGARCFDVVVGRWGELRVPPAVVFTSRTGLPCSAPRCTIASAMRLACCRIRLVAPILPPVRSPEGFYRHTNFLERSGMRPCPALPAISVTRGLRLPLRSTLIRPAVSSARSARRFASGSTPHSCSIRLETVKLVSRRNPLRCHSASPTNNALTPSRLA